MNRNRCALACALAFASCSAFAQSEGGRTPTTAVVADTLIQLYGHLDLSLDVATKGIKSGDMNAGGATADGRLGWQPDISSNLSYFGVRGSHNIGDGYRMVFQLEVQADVAATPGTSSNTASGDTAVKGAFASRNSFLGISSGWGAVKLGKTDTPYKLSTARLDPFSASVGDYNSIMGNTGGDNRAEFDQRLSHAAWYESPNMGGFRVNVLWSPGQNRASDNSIVASGEPDCTGGNSGGNAPGGFGPSFTGGAGVPGPCTDGSFGNAYSISGVYEAGPLYTTLAWERHQDVNRTGDEAGGLATAGTVGVRNEQAVKLGGQYTFPTRTTVNAIIERMTRDAPNANFNERQRNGSWIAVTQGLTEKDEVNAGWAHAGKTPGDPGVGPIDNKADMISLGYKHHFDRSANWYVVYAHQDNKPGAHYDLGASGHGITTDCHDAAGNCFPGKTLQALSVGMQYTF